MLIVRSGLAKSRVSTASLTVENLWFATNPATRLNFWSGRPPSGAKLTNCATLPTRARSSRERSLRNDMTGLQRGKVPIDLGTQYHIGAPGSLRVTAFFTQSTATQKDS